MKKWYVFDEADCFADYDAVSQAAQCAQSLIDDGMEGIHIVYMSPRQVAVYCATGNMEEGFAADKPTEKGTS